MPVGKMEINALENLLRIGGTSASGQHIPTLSDVDLDLMSDDGVVKFTTKYIHWFILFWRSLIF